MLLTFIHAERFCLLYYTCKKNMVKKHSETRHGRQPLKIHATISLFASIDFSTTHDYIQSTPLCWEDTRDQIPGDSIKNLAPVSMSNKTFHHKISQNFNRQLCALKLLGCSDIQQVSRQRHGHDDVIKWKHFPRHWPFVRGIHRSPVNSLYKGHWRGDLMFSLMCAWTNG